MNEVLAGSVRALRLQRIDEGADFSGKAQARHLKLTPFRGHLTVMQRGVRHAQIKAAVPGGISPTDH